MKIVYLTANYLLQERKTGVQLYYENSIKAMMKNGADIKVMVFPGFRRIKKKLSSLNLKPFKDILLVRPFFRQLWLEKINIPFFFKKNTYYVFDGFLPKSKKIKKVIVVHDLMSVIYKENYSGRNYDWLNVIVPNNVDNIEKILVDSISTKKDLIHYLHIPEEKISLAYPGCDLDLYTPPYNRIVNKERYLLFMGEMRVNKNVLNMVKGFELYLKQNSNSPMIFKIVSSSGSEYEKVVSYINESSYKEHFEILDYVSEQEKVELLQKAHALLFATTYEGFGLPVIEAMAAETPVITSNTSSLKEIAEGAALLVSPDNIQEIADAITKLDDDSICSDLLQKGSERCKKFTWDNCAKSIIQALGL